ncbi:hypothetical protein, partial [Serratia quinivorans]
VRQGKCLQNPMFVHCCGQAISFNFFRESKPNAIITAMDNATINFFTQPVPLFPASHLDRGRGLDWPLYFHTLFIT